MRPELLQSRFEVDTLLIIAEERPPEYNRVGLNVTSMLSAFDETVRRRRSMFYTKAINHGERSTPCLEVASRPTLLKGEKSPPPTESGYNHLAPPSGPVTSPSGATGGDELCS